MNSVETILSIIIMVVLGYSLRRGSILKPGDAHTLNKIVINVAIPSLIFLAMYNSDMQAISSSAIIPLICILISFLTGVVAYLWTKGKGFSKKVSWSIIIPTAMLNSGFMGYPIALGIFGQEGMVRAVFYDMGSILVFIGLGIILMFIFKGDYRDILKRALIFPPLWGIILGIMANYLQIPLGGVISGVLIYLSGAAIPLIMISLGLSLEFRGIKENMGAASFVSLVRLIISPLIALMVVTMVGLGGLEKTVTLLEAAMPSAMLSMVLAITYDLDVKLTAACVFCSTVLSLISLPFIISLI